MSLSYVVKTLNSVNVDDLHKNCFCWQNLVEVYHLCAGVVIGNCYEKIEKESVHKQACVKVS